MKRQIVFFFLVSAVCFLLGCSGNRYLKNYSGDRYQKTENCDVVNAELKFYTTKQTFDQQLENYRQKGYEVIGMGSNDAVRTCDNSGASVYIGYGMFVDGGESECVETKIDKKNQKRLRKACMAVGGRIALYDSKKILYLR